MWGLASRCTLIVFFASAIVVWLVAAIVRRRRDVQEVTLDTACAVSWLTPTILFIRAGSVWSAVSAAVFAVTFTRTLLMNRRTTLEASGERWIVSGLAIAVLLQASVVATMSAQWRTASFLWAALLLAATWTFTRSAVWPPRKPRRVRFRAIPALFFAVTFSAGGLTPYLQRGYGTGAGSDSLGGQADRADRAKPQSGDGIPVESDAWPGVVLYPDVEQHAILMPSLPSMRRGLFRGREANPLSIPFYAAYWFFRGRRETRPEGLLAASDARWRR